MVDFCFKYNSGELSFTVDETNLLFYAPIGSLPKIKEEGKAIVEAIRNPIDSKALREIVKGKTNIAIIADDLTRTTPQCRILPLLLEELNEAGISDSMLTLVIALGTHRNMTEKEIHNRFGEEITRRIKIVNHDYKIDSCVDLGVTARGTPIQVNRVVYRAQVKISVGTVVPHPLAGWGGGGKMIQPGVSSELTTDYTHFLGGTYENPLGLVGNQENFIRQEIESVAARVGLDFIINTVQDFEGNFVGIYTGNFIRAHRTAIRCAEAIFRPEIPSRADIVICNAYPANLDYWQGYKPFVYSHLAVKDGGTIIFVIDAPEGVSGGAPKHEEIFSIWSTKDPETTLAALESGEIKDRNCGAICVAQARLLKRAKVICVSMGMSDDEIRNLGFIPAESIGEALELSFATHGRNAKVGVIPYGGETIVKVKK